MFGIIFIKTFCGDIKRYIIFIHRITIQISNERRQCFRSCQFDNKAMV